MKAPIFDSMHDAVEYMRTMPDFQRVPYDADEQEALFMRGRTRAYIGQPHTFTGDRGSAAFENVTVRDIGDAVCTVLHRFQERFGSNVDDWDTTAVGQQVCVLVEKMARIYPNVPPLVQA